MGYPMWVNRVDAKARPDLFEILAENPKDVSPDSGRVVELAQRAMRDEDKQPNPTPVPKPKPPKDNPSTANWKVVDAMERDEIKDALDEIGADYSKYAHTSTLKDLLREHYGSAA